jgi:hypothetical protein
MERASGILKAFKKVQKHRADKKVVSPKLSET